jgi:hypothetical protein
VAVGVLLEGSGRGRAAGGERPLEGVAIGGQPRRAGFGPRRAGEWMAACCSAWRLIEAWSRLWSGKVVEGAAGRCYARGEVIEVWLFEGCTSGVHAGFVGSVWSCHWAAAGGVVGLHSHGKC